MSELVIVRHGQSAGNKGHRFSGWTDSPLTPKGIDDLGQTGRMLAKAGYQFDHCFTSVLSRSVDAGRIVLDSMGQTELPLTQDWRLNERHFGALQGLDRIGALNTFGLRQLFRLIRSYTLLPPPLEDGDPRSSRIDPLYKSLRIAEKDLPMAESLEDTRDRVIPYWESTIKPRLQGDAQILIAGHKNSLRVLIQHIERLSNRNAVRLQILTSQPMIYKLDANQKLIERTSIGKPTRKYSRWTGISPA